MASSAEFVSWALEQLRPFGTVRARAMFGEYTVYINEKPLLLICDNTVFLKKHPCLETLMEGAPQAPPYPGAKPCYIVNLEEPALCGRALALVEPLTPLPKKRKKKGT